QATFTSDGTRAYVTGELDGTVAVVDATKHEVIHTIQLEGEMVRPMEVDLSPDDRIIYVTTGRGQKLVAIDSTTYEPIGEVTVGQRPWGLALSPDGKYLFTANGPSNDVSVVDSETLTVVATIPVGTSPWGVVTVPVKECPAATCSPLPGAFGSRILEAMVPGSRAPYDRANV